MCCYVHFRVPFVNYFLFKEVWLNLREYFYKEIFASFFIDSFKENEDTYMCLRHFLKGSQLFGLSVRFPGRHRPSTGDLS